MSLGNVGINADYSWDAGERARLLQSPSVGTSPELRRLAGGTSPAGAVFIVVNAALGAGLLNFPAAFNAAGGITAAISLQLVLLLFIISGLVILAHCADACSERTYQEVVRGVCGRTAGVLCEVLIAVYTFGTCIAFFIIIGDQLDKLLGAMMHTTAESPVPWYADRKFTISVTGVLLILPLSLPREISVQRYASFLSVLGTCYVTVVVVVRCIWPDTTIPSHEISSSSSSWLAVFNAVPTICFGYQCHVSSVPVYGSMQQQDIRRWGYIVTIAMFIALCVYTGTGVCGFLLFGSDVDQDVLLSFPSDDIAVAVARAFIILCVLTSYPILHYCGRAVLEGLWLRFTSQEPGEEPSKERRRRVLQTVIWFLLTLLLALFIPDIGRVISLIGGLAACFIFIFPGLCLIHLKLSEIHEHKSKSWWALLSYGVIMVTIGTFIFGQTTTKAIFVDLVG
ncbi:putative sodium-coupled neutral amino acid transporter 7 [Xenopus laevis]|uniref:Sodium-coupled neutral amino acid transporter 7 n=1 Tax=Xenopus laevis TaxID=8355 RepID=S38A7_XENLA|nr:sodium-coupled neutral amino acid transporter 7 [Xenopus laevis]Q6DFE7.1 RecName: Full=Sodium-coupled neutral amino acid transporter 7; AltName: Full=Solute carrier family 38 member 7 [Xenopus laevis]AAH76791.1 Slc38a7 protein [Xenopus laevis]